MFWGGATTEGTNGPVPGETLTAMGTCTITPSVCNASTTTDEDGISIAAMTSNVVDSASLITAITTTTVVETIVATSIVIGIAA